MQHLKYPPEERNIALDFDATASTNIPFWQNFVVMAQSQNYKVYIVTARHSNNIEEIKLHFGHLVTGIIATGHKAKLAFCRDIGLHIDIWADDSPWNVYVNIDGTPLVPKSFLEPDFGSDISSMIFPRNHPIRIRGFGFYYTDMHWEVPLIQQSFHRTKKGAYKAMREFLWKAEEEHFHKYKTARRRSILDTTSDKRQRKWSGPFPFSKWKIMPYVLEIHD